MKYDFAGWVTKNDIVCSDGVVIKHNAFAINDGQKVPLVWNHDHSSPDNTLGHMILHNRDEGVYGYGFFNDTENGRGAKELLKHGDICAMSIGANKIKKQGNNVVHGRIFEVSLVLAGANPGAMIDEIVTHSEDDTSEAIIYNGLLIHSADSELEHDDPEGGTKVDEEENKASQPEEGKEKTIGEVLEGLTDEQMAAVEQLLANAVGDEEDGEEEPPAPKPEDNNDPEDGGEEMKHNVFEGKDPQEKSLLHAKKAELSAAIADAAKNGKGTLKEIIAETLGDNSEELAHSVDAELQHGITNIEKLFPNATAVTNAPIVFGPHNTEAEKIVNAVKKVPFSRIKSHFADMTEEEARAKGYIKGKQKKEQFFSIVQRETYPQTIYKKQKLDRDDIIDITDFDIVPFINAEMRQMLNEELARAILVGDGRGSGAEDKIKEDKIRPIISDDDTFVIKATFRQPADFLEAIVMNIADLRGSGNYTMYVDPKLISQVRLLKGTDGRFLSGKLPSLAELAADFGVREIVPTEIMAGKGALIVNLNDYNLGANKGGQVTTFDDFDIDFNQYKYLIETRVSGALVLPKSALVLTQDPATTTTTTTSTTTTTTTRA